MSPRPKKIRQCASHFRGYAYKPVGIPMTDLPQVQLFHDELEAMRLCDREGMTQEEAGQCMGVSRGTIQRIITEARRKTALSLTEGFALVFVGENQAEAAKETD